MRWYVDAFRFEGHPVLNIPYLQIKYHVVGDLFIEWSHQLSSSIRTASIFRSQWSCRSVAHDTRGEEQSSAEDKSLFLRLSRGRRGHPDKGRIQQNGFRQVQCSLFHQCLSFTNKWICRIIELRGKSSSVLVIVLEFRKNTGKTYRLDRQIFHGADFGAMFYLLYCTIWA